MDSQKGMNQATHFFFCTGVYIPQLKPGTHLSTDLKREDEQLWVRCEMAARSGTRTRALLIHVYRR